MASLLLASVALLGQVATPLLHSLGSEHPLRVDGHQHVGACATGVGLQAGATRGAAHHDATSCPLCRSLHQSRHSVAPQPGPVVAVPEGIADVAPITFLPRCAPARAAAAPRAPPHLS